MAASLARLIARRDRLNRAGDASGYYWNPYAEPGDHDFGLALDTYPHRNGSEWNRKRIRIRNRLNAKINAIRSAR